MARPPPSSTRWRPAACCWTPAAARPALALLVLAACLRLVSAQTFQSPASYILPNPLPAADWPSSSGATYYNFLGSTYVSWFRTGVTACSQTAACCQSMLLASNNIPTANPWAVAPYTPFNLPMNAFTNNMLGTGFDCASPKMYAIGGNYRLDPTVWRNTPVKTQFLVDFYNWWSNFPATCGGVSYPNGAPMYWAVAMVDQNTGVEYQLMPTAESRNPPRNSSNLYYPGTVAGWQSYGGWSPPEFQMMPGTNYTYQLTSWALNTPGCIADKDGVWWGRLYLGCVAPNGVTAHPTGGSYTITSAVRFLTVTGSGTAVRPVDEPLDYRWIVYCPGKAPFEATVTGNNTYDIKVGGPQRPLTLDGHAWRCNTTLYVYTAGNCVSTKATAFIQLPAINITVDADTGGPYSAVAPPGAQNTTVLVNGSQTYCPYGPCLYNWTVSCPGKPDAYYNGSTLELTGGDDPAADLDTSGSYAPVVCQISLFVIDQEGANSTDTSTVSVSGPPPPVANTGGPYTGSISTPGEVLILPVTGNQTQCTNPDCTYVWILTCPGGASTNLTGVEPNITAGADSTATIDVSAATSNTVCNLTLEVTDAGARSNTKTTTITISPPPNPVASTGGPYSGVVPPAAGTLTVSMNATGSLCYAPQCVYDWTVSCPGLSPVHVSGDTVDVTAGSDATNNIDTTGWATPKTCPVTLTVSDARGVNSTRTTTLTITPPAPPQAYTGGPYVGNVPPGSGSASVPINGASVNCTDTPCMYQWVLQCPGMTPVTLTDLNPTITAGPSSAETIDTTGLAVLNIRCSLDLTAVDESNRTSTARTTITIVPPPLPIARTSGPYNVSATSGTVLTVGVDGSASSCRDPDCSYDWTLNCPGQPAQTFTGITPTITAGPAGTSVPVGQGTGPISCTASLLIIDRSMRNATTSTTVTVMPPPLPVADDGGPYAGTVPPSGIATIQINGSMSKCGDPDCNYVWTLQCPGGAAPQTFNGLYPVFTAGPSASETVDTTGLRTPTTCSLILDMTDLRGKTDSSTTTVTITPPPLPAARTTGPYAVSATTGSDTPVPVDGGNSTCGDPDCTYDWELQCPGAAPQTFTGPQPYITAGSSSSNVDIGIRYTPFDCNLTLVVTDRSLRTSGINTRITVTPPPRPIARDKGPYTATVPPSGIATMVLDAGNSSCYDQPCQYLWTVSCPGVPDRTFSEIAPVVTAGPSSFETIDTTGKRAAVTCGLNLTVTDPRGHQDSSSTTLTVNPPPLPVARTSGPYSVSATTAVNTPVPVDASNTTCGDPDCTYAWTLRCPGVPDQTFTGATPLITAGGAAGATIDITGKMSAVVCNASVVVTDRSMRTSATSTRITVTPPPVPAVRPGGPYLESVPPSGIAIVPVDGGNTTCYDPGCTYNWLLSCPGKTAVSLSGPAPSVTAGPSPFNTIDTTGSKLNVTCAINLTVTDVRGKAVTAKTSIIVTPPPLPVAKTNGPWNTSATTGANTPVPVDASNTTCGDPDCTYNWLLRCPGKPDATFTGVTPDVTAGGTGSASIDITGATGPIRCNMSLTVTDRSMRVSQTSSRLTITPPPAPIPGSTGPYMMVVPPEGIATLAADAGNSTCFDPPCSFAWMLSCPNKTAVALTGPAPTLTAGPSPFETIDTTGARFNFTCTLNLTAVDVRGKATTTKTFVTVAPPSVPVARTTGPYNVTANSAAPTLVPLDGSNTTCNDLPCTYSWVIMCPNRSDVTTTGVTPSDISAGGPSATIDLTGVTSPIRCNVTLTVADRSQRISAVSTRLTVTPPPLPVIRTGGPYRTSVPPGGIATIPVVASNSSCYDPPCSYLWTLDCPNVAPVTFNTPDPILTAGPSPVETIDTTLARSNVTCNFTLAVTDATSRTVTSRTSVTVAPPPLPVARTSGPYSVLGDAFSTTVIPVDGTNSSCNDPECTWSWVLKCPNSPIAQDFSGPKPYVTAGGRGSSIEMLRIDNGTVTCNVTLTVIDRSGRSSAINTRITVSEPPPPPPPTARTTGPYRQSVPPGGIATITVDASNSSCAEQPCTHTWTLLCPNATAKTFDGITTAFTAGPSPSEGIDTTGVRGNFSCSLNVTVTDERGRPSVASTSVTISPPPLPTARTTGPYTLTASSTGLTPIPVSGINSTCGDPECTFNWLLQCAGMADQTFAGTPTPEITAGGAGATIPLSGANTTSVVCNMTLMLTDRSGRMSVASTRITVMPPGPPVPPNFGSGGVITTVPPGGTGLVPISSSNTTCSDAPCSYAWVLGCPGADPKTSNLADPAFTAGPSPSETIDTTGARGNLTCNITVTMIDAMGRSVTGGGRVIVITPPLPIARSNGPFNVTIVDGSNVPVTMDASNSTCNDPDCVYNWALACPSTDPKFVTGVTPQITVGDATATVDASSITTTTRCNVTLVVTDRSMRNVSTTTRLTIMPPSAPVPPNFGTGGAGMVVVPPGGQGSLPIDTNTTCYAPPCKYEWVVMCPKSAPKTYTDPVLIVAAGPSATNTVVDTTGIRGNFSCNFTVAITDNRNRTASARSFFSVVTPPLAKVSTGGPYNVTADAAKDVPVPVDASNTTCGDPECSYAWVVLCPGKAPLNFTRLNPVITVGASGSASIDTMGLTASFKCSMSLLATDRSNRTVVASTVLAVTIPGGSGGDPVTGGPYAVTVPPGAMGSVQLNGTGSPCVVAPCPYLWTLKCPDGQTKTWAEPSPVVTAGPSPSEDIDTTGLTAPMTCNLTLRVTDAPRAAGVAAVRESTTYITVTPPPLPGPLTGGPYSATGSGTSLVTIPVDASGSECNDPACMYDWTLLCPGKAAKQLSGEKPIVNAGNSPDATIDTTDAKGPVTCNITLVMTDRSKRTGAIFSTITVTPMAPPQPGEVDAGSNFVFSADQSSCGSPPCTYEWTCTATSIPVGSRGAALRGLRGSGTWTKPGAELTVTSGFGSSYDVDMTMQKDSQQVSCTCKTTDSQGRVTTGLAQVKVVKPLAPDCSKALAAPKGLKASTKVCSGTTGLYQTISLTPFQDPQGFTVSFNVTGISSNQLVPSCSSCGRRRNAQPQQGCTCAPAGKPISGGTAACVLPIVAKNRRKDGRIYRVSFVAKADTTLTCGGTVTVCVGGSKAGRSRRQSSAQKRAGYVDGFDQVDPNCTGTRCRPNPAGPLVCRDDGATYDATSTTCQTQS